MRAAIGISPSLRCDAIHPRVALDAAQRRLEGRHFLGSEKIGHTRRVVYFPASVDKGMFFYPDTYMRQMLTNACLWSAGNTPPPVEVQGLEGAVQLRLPDRLRGGAGHGQGHSLAPHQRPEQLKGH